MLKIFQRKKKVDNTIFSKGSFTEKIENIPNPCRGWYEVFNFDISEEPNFEILATSVVEDDTLALVFVDIGAKRDSRLSEEEIKRILSLIDFFYERGRYVILRLAYDHEGKAMEREPAFFQQVLEHMKDVGRVLTERRKEVFIYQGLLVGKWGEMHSSRYVNKERLEALYSAVAGYGGEEQFFAVRCPRQWRNINSEKSMVADPDCRVGLFDDGMFGSETDLGTFGNETRLTAGWNGGWSRAEELEFEKELCRYVPNGGEALYGEEFLNSHSAEEYLEDMRKMHVTYLNRKHDIRLIEHWKQNVYVGKDGWNGKSLYEYIGAHMGYRFIISDAEVLEGKNGNKLLITINNQGFANIYNKVDLILECESEQEKNSITITADLRDCNAGDVMVIEQEIGIKCGELFLTAKRKTDNKIISFANEKSDKNGRIHLGHLG